MLVLYNHVLGSILNTAKRKNVKKERTSDNKTWVIAKFISQIRTLLRMKRGAINNQTKTKPELH